MPIKGARYRWKTTKSGKKVRLTFVGKKVVEVKKKGGVAHRVDTKREKRGRRLLRLHPGFKMP